MALSATRRLAIEIALHKRADFGFGLRQSYDVGPCIQLSLSVAADDLVLPKREPLGVGLIQSGNTNVDPLLRIKHVDVAKVARIERQLDFRTQSPFAAVVRPSSGPLYFSPSNSMP